VFQAMVAARRGGLLERFRYVWYPLCTLTPAALAILAAAGYHYTARQLVIRLILTTYVLVGGIVCRALLLRWTLVNQRKLAIEQARQRRAAAQNESSSGEEPCGAADLPVSTTPERDLATINIQTRRLVEYSLAVACALAVWWSWIDVLPALSSVNATVWRTTVTLNVEEFMVNGKKSVKPIEVLREITLADLCLAAIILATTVIAAKNIPGLLEMAVLQHLPVDAGARYAVATVCRYVITVVGLLLCFGFLGLGWSKVQWLVAAMGLGLGFGLQEIFANFVSGLIILFERPVRVGDVVTIDTTTGVVSRIRMRATTITDGDRKELIIPNKEFITGRVLNWTLSDPVNRVAINVGIAYGSDTQRAAEILLKLAQDHSLVLADPPPRVSFESFGDSSLKFVLRCYLPNLDNRGTVIHDLHMAIDREFRIAGIEIAYPQQDVHVRSVDLPLSVFQSAMAQRAA
jgi:potassium-dependent mechanosensitive channel